jgi:hypothetical protein
MTFEDAIRKSIKAYFKGKEPLEYKKSLSKPRKYDKKYFDGIEQEFFGEKESDDV